MKRLLIRSCLIAGLVCAASCASNKETAVQEPAAAPVMQPEQTAAALSLIHISEPTRP